jgi:hypothetical protein
MKLMKGGRDVAGALLLESQHHKALLDELQ